MTCPTTPAQWQQITEEFYRKWNFPHACGALDGKHIAIRCPGGSGSTYFNYKKFYSIVPLALVDANYKFLWADVGGRGSASDAQIYSESELKDLYQSAQRTQPYAEKTLLTRRGHASYTQSIRTTWCSFVDSTLIFVMHTHTYAMRTLLERQWHGMRTLWTRCTYVGSAQFNSYAGKVVRMRTFVIRSAYAEPIR